MLYFSVNQNSLTITSRELRMAGMLPRRRLPQDCSSFRRPRMPGLGMPMVSIALAGNLRSARMR